MDRVHEVAALDETWIVTILIGEPQSGQRHIGIGYRVLETNEVYYLHLAWHCCLKNEITSPVYFSHCVKPQLPENRLRQLSAYCRRVWRANGKSKIPYAFSPPNNSLDAVTGAILLGPTRHGLTCASFILAVFEAIGVRLLQYQEWPSGRPGDRQWQEHIIELLVESGEASEAHINHLRREIGAVRYWPAEVAAGAAIAPPPASFYTASALGEQIVERITQPAA